MKSIPSRALSILALALSAGAAAGMPLWLDPPTRSNPHDPKSNLFNPALIFPSSSATPGTIGPSQTPTPTRSATPPAAGSKIFEDFDSAPGIKDGNNYNDGAGSGVTGTVDTAEAVSAPNSLRINLVTGSSWGGGLAFSSNYGAPTLDMSGATAMTFKIKTDQNLDFTARFRENGPDSDVNNENWMSPPIHLNASPAWQDVSIPISSFTEDPYGEGPCAGAGNCNQSPNGNGTMELGAVYAVQFHFMSNIPTAVVFMDDIAFSTAPAAATPTPSMTPTPAAGTATDSPTPGPGGSSVLFEDFENGGPLSPGQFAGSGSPSASLSNSEFHGGAGSMHLSIPGANGGYAGVNILSNYGIINAGGSISLEFWMKSDTAAPFTARFSENASGLENENWVSPPQSISAGTGWQHYSLPLSAFSEDDYGDPSCAGTCSQAGKGNNTMELGAVDRFELVFAPFTGNAEVFVDDVEFSH